MFSNTFVISAVAVEETATTLLNAALYNAAPTSKQLEVAPPIIFGMPLMSNFYLLISALESKQGKICSHVKTILMQRGVEMLVVVPGYVVLSRERTWPGLKNGTRADIVLSRKLKSGSRFLVNGVGTHMITASHCETIEKLAVKQDFLRALFLPRLLRCDQCMNSRR